MRPRIAVIGGGISGLAAAYEIASRAPSLDVTLLEASNRLGGVLESTLRDGFLIEAAADGFLTSPTAAVDLAQRLGLESDVINTEPSLRQAFVIHSGQMQAIPAGFHVLAPSRIRPMFTSQLLSWRGKLRLGWEVFIPPNRSTEDESLASFVRRRFGRETFDRLAQPLVGSVYTGDAERLSVEATMPHFRELERQHGSLLRAALRQRRSRVRENGSGARYGQFVTLSGGMSSLVQAIASRLPAQSIQLASPVCAVTPLEDERWLLKVGGEFPRDLSVDGLIVAAPASRAAVLLSAVDSQLAEDLAQVEYASCAVVSLGYCRDQVQHALDGFGFVVPLVERRSILSCSFASVKYPGRAPDGCVLLRVFIGGASQSGLLRLSNHQLVSLAEREIAELLQISGAPALRHITRHTRAMPQYHVGHRERVAAIHERIARFRTLALAGSAYRGVGVPACIQSGQVAAERVSSQVKLCRKKACCATNGPPEGVDLVKTRAC